MLTTRFQLNSASGLMEGVRYVPSPHCDDRPHGVEIDLLVIHCISLPPGQFGTNDIERFFCGQLDVPRHPYFQEIGQLRVSSHLLIKRTGEVIQFVPFTKRAWHAGQSSFQGRTQCNDFSIGIELEGTDTMAYEPAQYDQLGSVVEAIRHAYPAVTTGRMVGHSEIAPGRKTDPGPMFDWDRVKSGSR